MANGGNVDRLEVILQGIAASFGARNFNACFKQVRELEVFVEGEQYRTGGAQWNIPYDFDHGEGEEEEEEKEGEEAENMLNFDEMLVEDNENPIQVIAPNPIQVIAPNPIQVIAPNPIQVIAPNQIQQQLVVIAHDQNQLPVDVANQEHGQLLEAPRQSNRTRLLTQTKHKCLTQREEGDEEGANDVNDQDYEEEEEEEEEDDEEDYDEVDGEDDGSAEE